MNNQLKTQLKIVRARGGDFFMGSNPALVAENKYFIARVAGPEDSVFVRIVARWTASEAEMIRKTEEEVDTLFAAGQSILVFDKKTGKLVGHVAVTFEYHDGKIEVGSLYTDTKERNRGIATFAVLALLELVKRRFPKQAIFAMANSRSIGLFERIGGMVIDCERVQQDVWDLCKSCPMSKGPKFGPVKPCVHTPINLTHAV